jgi:hypothetical protein
MRLSLSTVVKSVVVRKGIGKKLFVQHYNEDYIDLEILNYVWKNNQSAFLNINRIL